jgi:iron complex outermembrane receptor protein
MTFRKLVSLSAVATALFASQSAYASDQDNAGTADTEQAKVPSDEQAAGVADIVVTANKQSQSLQKAPVAITAISGAQIVSSGITDIRAAQAFVPSVRFQAQNTVTELYIRGVGQTQDHAQFDPPIASL